MTKLIKIFLFWILIFSYISGINAQTNDITKDKNNNEILKQQADSGNAEAQWLYGEVLFISKEYDKAIEYIRKSLQQKNEYAMSIVWAGIFIKLPEKYKTNSLVTEMLAYTKEACNMKYILPCKVLSIIYTKGEEGIPVDTKEARKWFKKSKNGKKISPNTIKHNKQNTAIDNYKTRYTPEGRKQAGKQGIYRKDIHVWVYTNEFAERFGMPEEWVDDGLKGADALAYRVDWGKRGLSCGYFGELENCRPTPACVMDIYINDNADLPWNTEKRFGTFYGRKSNRFFVPQNKNDKSSLTKFITKRGQKYKLGLDLSTIVYGKNDQGRIGSYSVLEYDRDIYKDLDYLSGSITCNSVAVRRDIKINIYDAVFRENGSVSIKSLKNLNHQIKIPDGFMQKIQDYDKKYYEPKSLFNEVKKRLINTTKPTNKTK